MIWIPLAILRSVITSGLILFQKLDKTDKTDKFLFPTITTIIIGFIALIYYIFNYNTNNLEELYKPKYYIYSIVVFGVILLSYYIIKICPNPAYFRSFVALEIMLLLIYSIYTNQFYISNIGIIGIVLIGLGIIFVSCDQV
jgi:glucan phosphoethanolaminetransferase (alkaline phosphatase superfamily)